MLRSLQVRVHKQRTILRVGVKSRSPEFRRESRPQPLTPTLVPCPGSLGTRLDHISVKLFERSALRNSTTSRHLHLQSPIAHIATVFQTNISKTSTRPSNSPCRTWMSDPRHQLSRLPPPLRPQHSTRIRIPLFD